MGYQWEEKLKNIKNSSCLSSSTFKKLFRAVAGTKCWHLQFSSPKHYLRVIYKFTLATRLPFLAHHTKKVIFHKYLWLNCHKSWKEVKTPQLGKKHCYNLQRACLQPPPKHCCPSYNHNTLKHGIFTVKCFKLNSESWKINKAVTTLKHVSHYYGTNAVDTIIQNRKQFIN